MRTESYTITLKRGSTSGTTILTAEGGYGQMAGNILEAVSGFGAAEVQYELTPKLLRTGSYITSTHVPEKTMDFTLLMPNDDSSRDAYNELCETIQDSLQCTIEVITRSNGVVESTKIYQGYVTSVTNPDNFTRTLTRLSFTFLVPSGTETGGQL